ncbi:hypothetical protein MHY87_06565 [Microvirga sp. ACRRW]|uniref:hypothetical protein n=1 Tax=Microvirga sp. ACRRW TaxID=2918205 RepID=UPI001EF5488F|nr:hypothetical protein [Microvirga sp. ACRRW]MCG7392565.1 hypothetical protein [Microvirga sp. ACRRW]
MSVPSWRSLSFSQSDLELLLPGFVSSAAMKYSSLIFITASTMLIGCNTKPETRPNFIFNTQDLNQKQFRQAEAECDLEAEKVAMQASNGITAGERWRKIFILCMEAKGIRFVGTADQVPPDAKSHRIHQ